MKENLIAIAGGRILRPHRRSSLDKCLVPSMDTVSRNEVRTYLSTFTGYRAKGFQPLAGGLLFLLTDGGLISVGAPFLGQKRPTKIVASLGSTTSQNSFSKASATCCCATCMRVRAIIAT